MDAPAAMGDRHSSTIMPWSRPASVVPGSSARGSAQKALNQPAPSPLFSRGSGGLFDPRSDAWVGSDNFGSETQDSSTTVSGVSTQQFLNYTMEEAEKATGTTDNGRRWVEFKQLANPDIHDKQVAAQAFLHILCLATKGAIAVHQDGEESLQPFGTIHIGIHASVIGNTN